MSHVKFLARTTFNKIFKGVSEDLKEDISKVRIGIIFPEGKAKFEAYRNTEKVKDIKPDDYLGMFDVGIHAIDQTICNAGVIYCKELNCSFDDINIIMQYNKGELPVAVLLKQNKKERNIDIEKEFLKS